MISKKICIITVLLLQSVLSLAQKNRYKDSLLTVILTKKEDSAKVISYLHYGELFETQNPDSAMWYYSRSWQLANKLKYEEALAMNVSYQIVVLNNQGKFREALSLCKQAVSIYQKLHSDKDLAIAYNNLANEYQYLGELQPAANHYIQAVRLAEKVRDSSRIQLFTNNVASVFTTLKQYEKALFYATAAYKIAIQLKDTFGIAASLVNMSASEVALNQYKRAMEHLRQVLVYSKYLDDYTLALDGYTNIGSVENNLKNYNEAIQQFSRSLKIARDNNNASYELVSLQGLTDAYSSLHQWKKADEAANEAIRLASKIGARNELKDSYVKSAEVKEALGNLSGALTLRKKYELLNDSLLNEKVQSDINELEIQFQTAKKDQSIAEQNLILEKNKIAIHNKNIWLVFTIAGLIAVSLILLFSYRIYRQRQKLNAERILALQKEQEIVRLQALLEGQDAERQRIAKEMHDDIGAGLTSILYMSESLGYLNFEEREKTCTKISSMANSLVDKMNEVIWSLNKEYDTLEDLVTYIRHSLSELLENTGLQYEFCQPESVPDCTISGEQRRNVYLVVKESAHNAIKHSGATLITIEFEFIPELIIKVMDNGRGIDQNKIRKFGNGLKNMQQRMKKVGGRFEIISGNGTTIEVGLPLIYNNCSIGAAVL